VPQISLTIEIRTPFRSRLDVSVGGVFSRHESISGRLVCRIPPIFPHPKNTREKAGLPIRFGRKRSPEEAIDPAKLELAGGTILGKE
jgi:hypothetical protein